VHSEKIAIPISIPGISAVAEKFRSRDYAEAQSARMAASLNRKRESKIDEVSQSNHGAVVNYPRQSDPSAL
jgi:hypothetical protein